MQKPRSTLTCQSEANPVGFASLCGKINSITHLKRVAKELSDKQLEKVKQVSGDTLTRHSRTDHTQDMAATHVEGEWLCATMMVCCKCVMSSNDNNIGDGDENEPVDMSADTSAECAGSRLSKQMRSATLRCQTTHVQLERMIEATERQVELEKLRHMRQDEYHKGIMAIQQCACDIQECTSLALLDILCQSLLPPS